MRIANEMVFGNINIMNDRAVYRKHLDRIGRFFLTIILYLIFGIGALIVSLLIVPFVLAVTWNHYLRIKRVREINHRAFNLFTRSGILLGVFDVSFDGACRLNLPGQLIIANHPSLLDVVFLIGHIHNVNCVVKKKLLRNPFLVGPVYFANYICNDGGEELLQYCIDSIARGESVIIFPEGTRTVHGQHYDFKRGAAYLMLMSNCPVRPVYITCEPSALRKEDLWYMIPERKITYRFTVMDKLDMTAIRSADYIRLPRKSRLLTKWLANWYREMDSQGPHSPRKLVLPPAGQR